MGSSSLRRRVSAYAPTRRTAPPSTPFAPCSNAPCASSGSAPSRTTPICQAAMPSCGQSGGRGIRLVGRDDRDEADAEVPGALGRLEVEIAEIGEHAEDGRRRPRRAVDLDPRALREHAGEVRRDAAAGHVAECVDAARDAADQAQERRGVQARGLEERLAPRRAEVGGVVAVLDAGAGHDVPHERVAVRVQSAAREREHDVARAHAVGAEDAVGLDDAGRGARDVVVVDAEKARGARRSRRRRARFRSRGSRARCRRRCRRCARGRPCRTRCSRS